MAWVLGLRRGLAAAGVGSQVAALFPVEDDTVRVFMERLHDSLLAGATPAEAVRRASLDRLSATRAAGRAADVRSWGAFVALGPGAGSSPLGAAREAAEVLP